MTGGWLEIEDWTASARCAGVLTDLMYPAPTDTAGIREAKAVCASCPVAATCLVEAMREEYGKSADSRWGVRGGLTAGERLALAAAAGEPVKTRGQGGRQLRPCGTLTAYHRHRKRKEPICRLCRDAYEADRAAQKADTA